MIPLAQFLQEKSERNLSKMRKTLLLISLFLSKMAFSQVVESDSVRKSMVADTSIAEPMLLEKPDLSVFDTLSYSEEYKRDIWRFTVGVRGGLSRGRYTLQEETINKVGSTGLPVLDENGKILKNRFINNSTFNSGYNVGLVFRFVRGSFYTQPEIGFSQKVGRFDILNNDGSLYKRVNGKISAIDIPILVGIRFRDARFFFGPTVNFAYQMNSEMKSALKEYTQESKLNHEFFTRPTLNFMVGLGFEFKNMFFDLRYEKGLNSYTQETLGSSNSPVPFKLLFDGIHLNIGFLKK